MNLTVACVLNPQDLNHGVKYSVEWVDKLYRAIKRNLDIQFEFVCLTNERTTYTTIPLSLNSDGYWNKIELFQKSLFNTPVLYLDLDVVICKNITEEIVKLPKDKFLLIKEPYRNIHNSSVMFWDGDYSYLFDQYQQFQQDIVNEYQYNLSRSGCLGDQAYICENVDHDLLDDYVQPGFIGWKHHKIDTDIVDPAILIFTGKQKPNNNTTLDLVKYHWI